jgi:hypothetical protein
MTSRKTVKLAASSPTPVILADPLALFDSLSAQHITVVFRSEQLGIGEPELGQALLQAFVQALEALAQPPETLIFYHTAVRLVTTSTPILEILQRLQKKGTEIMACSISLQHLGLTDQLAVGEINTMGMITERLQRARHILWP